MHVAILHNVSLSVGDAKKNIKEYFCGQKVPKEWHITYFRLSQQLIIDTDSVLELVHCLDVGNVTDISEVHGGCLCVCIYIAVLWKGWAGEEEIEFGLVHHLGQ